MQIVLILITLLTMVAGVIGTITGFGISTIMVPALAFVLPLPETLLLVGIIHWSGDIWKMILFRSGIRWRLIAAFGTPGVIAAIAGAGIIVSLPALVPLQLFGIFLIAYTVLLVIRPAFRVQANRRNMLIGGAASGFLAGVFGIGGAVRSVFLTAFDPEKDIFIATSGAIGLAVDTARIAAYVAGGIRLDPGLAAGFLLFIPASFAGALIAKQIVGIIPQERFRTVIAASLFAAGAYFLLG